MTNSKTNILFAVTALLSSAMLGAAETNPCVPGGIDSENHCNGAANCVEVKTKQHCNDNGKDYKKYFIEATVESITIEDINTEQVLVVGSNKWKFELTFFNEQGADVTGQLIRSGNLIDQCHANECRWAFHGGGLTANETDLTYKYTIKKHKGANHKVEALDPTIIVKPQK